MLRRLLLVLPALAVGIVLWAVLTTGWPAPVQIARVVGGPTLGASVLAWQLSVQRLSGERREPGAGLGVRLLVDTGSQRASWTGTTDAGGRVEARVPLSTPVRQPVHVRVETSHGQLLAEGDVELAADQWRKEARRQGGWIRGQQSGELSLRVCSSEGVLAVPFVSELIVHVSHGVLTELRAGAVAGDRDVAGATLELDLSGAERLGAAAPLRTDARGRARVRVRPLEHAILLGVRATASESALSAAEGAGAVRQPPRRGNGPASGEWSGALPVAPGALHAALDGARLSVRSPIPRDEAYVSVVDPWHRLAGYILPLRADDDGGASASVTLDRELLMGSGDLYAVASSEPDKRSASAVGWQLRAEVAAESAVTFDVADRLLLDGTEGMLEREREGRLVRRRVAGALLALVGLSMIGTFSLEARRSARRAAAAPAELALGSQRWLLALALSCLALGIGALAYFGLLQR